MNNEDSKKLIQELVDRFAQRQSEYETSGYLESQLRKDFVDKLFKALGWDMGNDKNLSQLQRDVLIEKGDTKGRPDYSFRINGEDRFFVETKTASKGTDKPEDILQAKLYGWNTRNVTIVVLTDFKTFKVYDASLKPDLKRPSVGLLFELHFTKYASADFDKLWLFSYEAVLAGSLDELSLKDAASKRLRIPVDVAFLDQMTGWREKLAKDVYKNNPEITVRSLNDVVQRLLDRLVFIRILEDRRIIESRTLKEIAEDWEVSKHRDIQTRLNALFKQLNNDFNGEIFKEHPCETTKYDSKIIAEIIDELYFPKSPYKFNVIGVELLGVIYEKYLGKTIRLTEKRVKVEEKPEVRKAGGVFYTPKWVVGYIVGNTIGKLIEKKTPEDIAKIRVLDPACGSGSFLLGALERILDYHLGYYLDHPKEAKHGTLFPNLIIDVDEDGNKLPRLSIEKKGEILKNNIYGVDLDPQAVEITMMSLYIKVLEGEKTLPHNKELLPSLSKNIRCGNSLIEFDFLSQQTLTEDAEREHANPFEWRSKATGFGNIIGEKDGFDAIIGNPPYIRIQTMKEWAPKEVEYFSRKYKTAASGNYDIYVVFVERAIQLLGEKGQFGFIMPHKFFQAGYGTNLRKLISDGKLLREIVNFNDQQVFDQATTYTCLFFLSKTKKESFKYAEVRKLENPVSQLAAIQKSEKYDNGTLRVGILPVAGISEEPWQFGFEAEVKLLEKLNHLGTHLEEVTERIFQGIRTSMDPVYVLNETKFVGKKLRGYSKILDRVVELEHGLCHPLLKGEQMRRYYIDMPRKVIIVPYENRMGSIKLIKQGKFRMKYPLAYKYLDANKKNLENREKGRMKTKQWYAYVYPKNLDVISKQKIVTTDIVNHNSFSIDEIGEFYFTSGYGIIPKEDMPIKYLLGILNSRLIEYLLKRKSTKFRGGYYSCEARFIKSLPIFSDLKEKQPIVNEITRYVGLILDLNKKRISVHDLSKKELLEREAKVYEEKIDKLVYKLYGLTEEEIEIVESFNKEKQ